MAEEKESPEDKNYHRFMSFLRNTWNMSEHTISSYGIDICQFAGLCLKKNPLEEQIDWDSVSVYDARNFIVSLQDEGLTKTRMQRKLSGLRSFFPLSCPGLPCPFQSVFRFDRSEKTEESAKIYDCCRSWQFA